MGNRTNERDLSFRPDPATIPSDGSDVEIATLTYLDGMTGAVSPASSPGVAVVLARRQDGRIAYRVEVDSGCETHERTPTTLPLPLGDLIALIDGLQAEGYEPNAMPRLRVSSDAYPMLGVYFAQRAEACRVGKGR